MSAKRKPAAPDKAQAAFEFDQVAGEPEQEAELQPREGMIHIPSARDFRVKREGLIDWYEVLRGHSLFEGLGE